MAEFMDLFDGHRILRVSLAHQQDLADFLEERKRNYERCVFVPTPTPPNAPRRCTKIQQMITGDTYSRICFINRRLVEFYNNIGSRDYVCSEGYKAGLEFNLENYDPDKTYSGAFFVPPHYNNVSYLPGCFMVNFTDGYIIVFEDGKYLLKRPKGADTLRNELITEIEKDICAPLGRC